MSSLVSMWVFLVLSVVFTCLLIVYSYEGRSDASFVCRIIACAWAGLSVLSLILFQCTKYRQKQHEHTNAVIGYQTLSEPAQESAGVIGQIDTT